MNSKVLPVITIPATDAATAALADWLIRDLSPLVLTGAGLQKTAGRVRGLPPVTEDCIGNPRKLRTHERRLRTALRSAEARLCHCTSYLSHSSLIARRHRDPVGVLSLPKELVDAVTRISRYIADLGSPAGALADCTVLISIAIVNSGAGTTSADVLRSMAGESYCAVLTALWSSEPLAQVELRDDT